MNRLTFLTAATLLTLMAGQAGAADKRAADKPSFVPPAAMVQSWAKFSDQAATGRIKEISSWKKHEKFAPCTADATLCKMITDQLSVLTVEVAKADGGTIVWLVSVPTEQNPKVGSYIKFTFPTEPMGLGAGVYDQNSRMVVVPKCSWGKDDSVATPSEGVLCPQWRYGQLPYFKVAAAAATVPASAPAAAPAASAASAASQP